MEDNDGEKEAEEGDGALVAHPLDRTDTAGTETPFQHCCLEWVELNPGGSANSKKGCEVRLRRAMMERGRGR